MTLFGSDMKMTLPPFDEMRSKRARNSAEGMRIVCSKRRRGMVGDRPTTPTMPVTVLIVECSTPAASREFSAKGFEYYLHRMRFGKTSCYSNGKETLRASIRRFDFAVTDKAEFATFVTALTRSNHTDVIFLEDVTRCMCGGSSCGECGYSAEQHVNKCTCSFTTCYWCCSSSSSPGNQAAS